MTTTERLLRLLRNRMMAENKDLRIERTYIPDGWCPPEFRKRMAEEDAFFSPGPAVRLQVHRDDSAGEGERAA